VQEGWNVLVGANRERIVMAVSDLQRHITLDGKRQYGERFGDGRSAERIVEALGEYLR
jgi:UDP-N-acetylglucosamine 2-epimerase